MAAEAGPRTAGGLRPGRAGFAFAADPFVRARPGYLHVRPPAGIPLRELLARIEELGEHTGRGDSLLVDMRGLRHIGNTENVLLAHHCGQHLRGARVAVLVPARTGQGQQAARSLGLDMRSFADEAWALEWLLEEA